MPQKTPRLIFLEGLPGCGKTNLIVQLQGLGVATIPEICAPENLAAAHNQEDQTFFLRNDEEKLRLAETAPHPVVIDRSPLSTVFFNLARSNPTKNHNLSKIISWYQQQFAQKFATNNKYAFIYIDISPDTSIARKGRRSDPADPWCNLNSLTFIRSCYLTLGPRWVKSFLCLDGTKKEQGLLRTLTQILKI